MHLPLPHVIQWEAANGGEERPSIEIYGLPVRRPFARFSVLHPLQEKILYQPIGRYAYAIAFGAHLVCLLQR